MDTESVLLGTNLRLPHAGVASSAKSSGCDNNDNNKTAAASIHLLPCSIEFDGAARVSDYFKPRRVANGNGGTSLEATLRGRLLRGKACPLPEGVEGFVLQQDNVRLGSVGKQQNYATSKGSFKELTYWNHDVVPSSMDYVPQALRWFDISRIAHAPIPLETEDGQDNNNQTSGRAPATP